MKSQQVILVILVSSLLAMATNAHERCNSLLQQCNQFKTKCSPDMIDIQSCCDLTALPIGKAPSGVYQLLSNCSCGSPFTSAVNAYCDMNTTNGGWMVIQRNIQDGENTFNKHWKDFEEGFGDLNGDKLWYGLKALHCHTQTGRWELRIDYQFENKTWSYLHYNNFRVGSTSEGYPLIIEGFTGYTPTDPHPLNGSRFTTIDNDNDEHNNNCASIFGNGWWYNKCYSINPNRQPPIVHFKYKRYYLLSIEMKIRRHDCTPRWI